LALQWQLPRSDKLTLVDGDIGLASTAEKIVANAVERFGSVDALVNNAGIFFAKPFTQYTTQDFRALSSTNLDGFIYTTQLVVERMLSQGAGGSIVSITASIADRPPAPRPPGRRFSQLIRPMKTVFTTCLQYFSPYRSGYCINGGSTTVRTDDRWSTNCSAITFGPFRLHSERRMLIHGNTVIRVGSRAWDILLLLVERAGEVVSKRELMDRVWPDTVVEDGTLRVHVSGLRKVLGDGQRGMRYVENVTGRGYRFTAPITRLGEAQPPPVAQVLAVPHPQNVPVPLTRTIGRTQVIATLSDRSPDRRFVTIAGPGGVGKTTVALAAADRLSDSYPDGIRFIDLGSIADPLLMPAAVASALGLATVAPDPIQSVIESVNSSRTLILLDNCEHVIEAAALFAEKLLRGARHVAIIATSREPLRARNEWVLRLAPLELPPPGAALTASEALRFSAIELFSERARASLDKFELTDADVPSVVDICRRLDGLPLAIELAAARVELFGIGGVSARLDDRLGLLARGPRTALPRHQTLRATLDWSYEILSREEQIALRRLAVFSSTFDSGSATAVIADEEVRASDVIDVLTNLAAKSLLVSHVDGKEVLYRLLDTSRAYALEKLGNSRESVQIKRRHAQVCCSWAANDRNCESRRHPAWPVANRQRLEDVRAALDWCFSSDGDACLGTNLTAVSAPLWFQSSLLDEYPGRLEQALRVLNTTPTSAALELELNAALGDAILYTTGSSPRVTAAFNRTLELAEKLGTTVHHRRALWGLWVGRISAGDYQSALGYAEAYCLFVKRSNDPTALLTGDRMMALAHHFSGNQVVAQRHAERALTHSGGHIAPFSDRPFQFEQRVAALAVLARILWIRGSANQAIVAARESLECAHSSGHALSLCYALSCLCNVLLWTGDVTEASRVASMLLEHSTRYSMRYWQFCGRCLLAAATRQESGTAVGCSLLRDPQCSPTHQEILATVHHSLATKEAFARADAGLAEWCAPELLRVRAEALLRNHDAPAAEGLLGRSLEIARNQGALSWELRTATSLARLRHSQCRTQEARALLTSVRGKFTEGFETADLISVSTLLDEMAPPKGISCPG